MASILAIESDNRQAALLKCVVRNHVGAALTVVTSTREAIAAIGSEPPDLVLLSALLSPREEEEAVAHLRGLNHADHLQTLTIPRFASTVEEEGRRGGLLGALTRRRPARRTTKGCDPKQFAEQISAYLQRAEDVKEERAAMAEAAAALAAREAVLTPPDASACPTPAAEEPPAAAPLAGPPAPDPAPAIVPDATPLAAWSAGLAATAFDWTLESDRSRAGEIQSLLHARGLPAALADLARAGGCRIHRVRVGSSGSSWRCAMMLGGSPSPPSRQSPPRVARRVVMSSYAAHA
jgi:cell division septation protein DedD